MSPERFHALLRSHGADLRRWPAAERAAAARLLDDNPAAVQHARAEAAQLDRWLDSHELPAPPPAMAQRILAGAPSARRVRTRPAWWAGAAAIGLAGSLAGAWAVSLALHSIAPPSEGLPRTTAFGGLPAEWSEGGEE